MNAAMNRIGKVGVLGYLDELERLMREFLVDKGGTAALADWHLSTFLEWLRQRERESVAGESNVERD